MQNYLEKTQTYLQEKLIPFWIARAVDEKYGGFQTNYDRFGKRSEITEKSFLAQCRSIFSIAHARRLGFDWPGAEAALQQGIDFLFKYFRDEKYDGYFWIVDEDGRILDTNKIVYGHSFLIYALAEYSLLTGDEQSKNEAIRIFDLLQEKAADSVNGCYFEHFDRQFNLKKAHATYNTHKSLDVHMHLMEAYTTLFELTGEKKHQQALETIIELIFAKMVDPETGTGISMFTEDWQAIANIELDTVWGRDRFDDDGKSPDITSYGHNIELAWLYLHALTILGISPGKHLARVQPIFEHTYKFGVDWQQGGLFVEGLRSGPVTESTKEFWQQAEALVGFLDAWLLTRDDKYLQAFRNIHDFVFSKMINHELGEWRALLDTGGKPIWDYMGTSWKVFYHTVRGTCLTVRKLEKVLEKQQKINEGR